MCDRLTESKHFAGQLNINLKWIIKHTYGTTLDTKRETERQRDREKDRFRNIDRDRGTDR